MAYIGRGIENLINAQKLDAITPSTATGVGPYNLTQNSVAFVPASADALVVSINGVVQYGNFTVSGSTITFSGALTDADTCDFIYQMGTGLLNTPADGTVNTAQLADGGVTNVKLGTDISASKITTGTLADARIPNLDTSKITTGTLDAARIDNASLANVTALPFSVGTDWQSTIVTGTTLTAVAGKGYWIDTTSNACTVTLPASASVGDFIEFSDYLRTWGTNAVTINQNSLNFQGYTSPNPEYNTDGQSVRIVYSGATQGWIPTVDDDVTNEVPQSYSADFLVVAGGGAGSFGGGGAGGYRTSTQTVTVGTAITVTVGDGGASLTGSEFRTQKGNNGSNSSISGTGITTITSAGGGGGGARSNTLATGADGGSGGGAGTGADGSEGVKNGGSGNTPATSPSQGNDGGTGEHIGGVSAAAGGGGGASAVGGNYSGSTGGNGGNGTASSITGSSVTRAGGGGGHGASTGGSGGTGGGGAGTTFGTATNGTANTGGGGGGSESEPSPNTTGAGGKGVVIISVPDADYSGTTTGSPTVATGVSGKTVLTFNGSGSYTA